MSSPVLSMISSWLLVVMRLSPLIVISPIEMIRALPLTARILLTFILGMCICSNLSYSSSHHLLIDIFIEFFNGCFIYLSIFLSQLAFNIGTQLIDLQSGFNLISLWNPTEHSQETLISRLFSLLCCVLLFHTNSHHLIIKYLYQSFNVIPLATIPPDNRLWDLLTHYGSIFLWGIVLFSPILLSLFIFDFFGIYIAKIFPQGNFIFFTSPFKFLFTMCALSLLLEKNSLWIDRFIALFGDLL